MGNHNSKNVWSWDRWIVWFFALKRWSDIDLFIYPAINLAITNVTLEKICHKHFNRFRVKNTEYFENVTFEEVLWFLVSLFDEPSYASSNEMHKKQYLKEHQK